MKKLFVITFVFIVTALFINFTFKKIDLRKAKNMNVCKSLKGDVLLYVVFVDGKYTSPWTEYDIQSTMDSIKIAVNWIKQQATEDNIKLNIITDYYLGKEFSIIKRDLPEQTLLKTATSPNLYKGIDNLNKWSDYISKKVGVSFNLTDKEGIPEIKQPKNKERLIAYLRDYHKVESVALLLMVNNYFKDDISIQANTMSDEDVEYSVVSFKYPAVIAHNFLHLFGAADLHESPYRKNDKNIKFAEREFPNEVMQNPYAKDISKLSVSPFNKYLIGWTDSIEPKYGELFFEKNIKIK